jgi:hypothetical protein
MSIHVKCPNPACARRMSVDDELAGRKRFCPYCRMTIEVPGTLVSRAELSQSRVLRSARRAPPPANPGMHVGCKAMAPPKAPTVQRTWAPTRALQRIVFWLPRFWRRRGSSTAGS